MYSRKISETPEKIIQNKKALFGTYASVPQSIDICGMRAPYAGIPLPAVISNMQIKSRLTYFFTTENYIGFTEFFDFKVVGIAQIIIWDKKTGNKNAYHSIMPPRRRFIPKKTKEGNCTSFKKSRHIRISWGRIHAHHSLSFKIKGSAGRPNVEGFLASSIQDPMHQDYLFVNPFPTASRCSASWFTTMQTRGLVKIQGEKSDESGGLAAMLLTRAYYKFYSSATIVCGIGSIDGKNIFFNLKTTSTDATDSDKYNENILIQEKISTTLPPVYITHSFGIDKPWIIQDTESMIDLTFTPISLDKYVFNVITLRNSATSIYGTFDGVLLNSEGEKIQLKNFTGILITNSLRM